MVSQLLVVVATVALVLVSPAFAIYVEYELFNASTCAPTTLVQTGIAGADKSCLVGTPDGSFVSRLFTCTGVINYPVTENCVDVGPIPNFPQYVVTTTALNTCNQIGTSASWIRYSCRLGGLVQSWQSQSPNCTALTDPIEGRAKREFFYDDKCTPGYDITTNTLSLSSAQAVVSNATSVTIFRWYVLFLHLSASYTNWLL